MITNCIVSVQQKIKGERNRPIPTIIFPVVAAGFSSLVYPTWFILISNGNHTKTILISNIYLNSVSKLHKNLSGGLEDRRSA